MNRHWWFFQLPCIVVLLLPAVAHAATLQVGIGKPYATVAAAVAAAGPGDIVEIDPGDYIDDIVVINAGDLTLRGVGEPRPHLRATSEIDNGKGIILINAGAAPVTVEHLELSGAAVPDLNGAGLRMQGSALVVRDCHFHDNQNGILAGADAPYTVEIYDSEFDHNGNPGSGQEHNVYIGNDPLSLTFQGNYSHHVYSGQILKSRARTNYILYNRLMDEADGTGSYLIDLPQGGLSYVVGNLIEQGPNAENHSTLVSYKAEVTTNADLRLFVVNNTLVNDNAAAPAFVRVYAADEVVMHNNLFVGQGTPLVLENGIAPAVTDEGNLQTDMPGLVDREAYDYRLVAGSVAIDAGVVPGNDDGFQLTPLRHYVHPASTIPRPVVDAIDVGAYEFGKGPPAGDTEGEGSDSGDPNDGGTGGPATSNGGETDDGGSKPATSTDSAQDSGDSDTGSTKATPGAGDNAGCGCRSSPGASWSGLFALAMGAWPRRRAGLGASRNTKEPVRRVVGLLLLNACTSETTRDEKTPLPCSSDHDCPGTLTCGHGVCEQTDAPCLGLECAGSARGECEDDRCLCGKGFSNAVSEVLCCATDGPDAICDSVQAAPGRAGGLCLGPDGTCAADGVLCDRSRNVCMDPDHPCLGFYCGGSERGACSVSHGSPRCVCNEGFENESYSLYCCPVDASDPSCDG